MLLNISKWGAALGGALSAGAACTVIYGFFYDPTPRNLEEATESLSKIAKIVEALVQTESDTEALREIQVQAAKIGSATVRSLEDQEAFIVRVTQGVFDLPVGETYELVFPNGKSILLNHLNQYSSLKHSSIILNGEHTDLYIGRGLKIDLYGDTCRLEYISLINKTFRWRCSGF
ncbi:MAG: hypothetical protein ACPGNV_00820 [Mangrovicoccus sp.]